MIGFRRPRGRQVRRRARAAAGSWEALVAAVMPAVEAALHRVDEGAREAAERTGQVRARAAERTRHAVDALRGKPRRRPPWQWLAVAVAAGAVIGAAGAVAARRAVNDAIQRRHSEEPVDAIADVAGESAATPAHDADRPAPDTAREPGQADPGEDARQT